MHELDELPVVTGASKEYRNPRQQFDYRNEREECLDGFQETADFSATPQD